MDKIKVSKNDLLKALQLAGHAISSKPVIPLLGNLLLEVEDGSGRVSGTNYDIGIRTSFPVTGKDVSFITTFPAKLATDLVNNIQAEYIDITFDKVIQQITMKTENSSNNVKCMDGSDYPTIQSVVKPITVPTIAFREAVTRVAFAASANVNLQTPLHGVLATIEAGKMVIFAVDGFHLSYEEIALNPIDGKRELKAVVAADALENVCRILEGEFFEMCVTENQVRFRSGNNEITTQLLTGDLPNRSLIKLGQPKTTIEASTLELLRACKQLELFTFNGFTVLEVKGMLIEISAEDEQQGSSVVTHGGSVSGEPIAIGLNIFMFKQFLQVCKTETFTLEMTDAKSPMLFKMKDFPSFYHIIMPMGLTK